MPSIPANDAADLRRAVIDLGYPSLSNDVDVCIAEIEEAIGFLEAGEDAKTLRFRMYELWARKA